MIERILQIIDYKGINKSIFYKETGLSNGFLDKVKDIGVSKLELILKTYPDIDMKWLLTGKGSMLKNTYNLKPTTYLHDNIEEKKVDKDYMIEVQKKLIEKLEKEVKELKEQLDDKAKV